MGRYLTLSLACFVVTEALTAQQIPFFTRGSQLEPSALGEWDLLSAERPPKTNSHNLVFDSIASLSQHWPNTRWRNGHNLVPGIIPTGTILHHGGYSPNMPEHLGWVATDPEHSYIFASGPRCFKPRGPPKSSSNIEHESSCWLLSLATSRPLKVLYFDGRSGAKIPRSIPPNIAGGAMDTQDIMIWGEVREDKAYADDERLQALCHRWGPSGTEVAEGKGFDGFVRMENNFEVMICDFSTSFELVTALKPAMPTRDPLDTDMGFSRTAIIESGSWHDRAPGETRINLDLTRFISFFDDGLFPILSTLRSSQERREHRVKGISQRDVETFTKALKNTIESESSSSGIDWKAVFQVVTDRYTDRLQIVQGLLDGLQKTTSGEDMVDTGKKVQAVLRTMLAPYIPIAFTPSDLPQTFKQASPVFELCSTTTTKHLLKKSSSSYTSSERLMRDAIRTTNKEICRVIVKAWAKGTVLGLDNISGPEDPAPLSEIEDMLAEWQEEMGGLMKWLGWSVWQTCNPACRLEEICYLPPWPIRNKKTTSHKIFDGADELNKVAYSEKSSIGVQNDEWLDPQPGCLRRVPATARLFDAIV